MKKILFLSILAILFSTALHAQTFNMSTSSNNVNCSTGGTLYDSGGSAAGYADNESFVFTVCPGSPGFGVFADMSLISIASGDVLNIYNGDDVTAPLFPDMPLDENTAYSLGAQFQATVGNPTGCLTFEFISNGDGITGDFEFNLTCNARCQEFYSTISSSIPDTTLTPTDIYIDVCLGDSIIVTASDSFPENNLEYAQSNATSTFEWYWDLSSTVADTGISQSHLYTAPGGYLAKLISYDINGCRNYQDQIFKVRVAPEPEFVELTDSIFCLGESDTLTGLPMGTIVNGQIVQGDTVYFVPPFYSGDSTFLPDGNGAVYTSPAQLTGFDLGDTITNCGDILEICINMEHSYLGDLGIELVCPNGQSVTLKAYPGGGGTYLGNPYDNTTQAMGPGDGLDYCFSDASTNGLLVNGPTQAATLEPGNTIVPDVYQPVDPFTDLIGCPINGLWQLQIQDNLTIDDGYIFNWSLNIDPCMYPEVDSFIMVYNLGYWDPEPTIIDTVGSSNTIIVQPNSVGANSYTYHTTNQFGCDYENTYDIFTDGFTVNATPDDTTVCAGEPVQLNAEVLGSVSSCTYTFNLADSWGDGWNGNSLIARIDGIIAGTYTIATGSSATFNLTVPGGSTLELTYDGLGSFQNEVSYTVLTNGATVFSDGPSPAVGVVYTSTCGGFYTYNWTPALDLDDNTIANPVSTLSGGGLEYTVGVTNANGCTYYDTLNVNSTASFEFSAYGDTTICFGDTAQLFTTGGAISYAWTPNDGSISDTTAANPFVYPTATTTYNVQADSTGCSQYANITVEVSNIQVLNILPTAATCGVANGGLIVFANGAAPGTALTFILDNGVPQSNGVFSGLYGGTHALQITDSTGCPLDTLITIGGGAPLVIDTVMLQDASCGNVNDASIEVLLTDTNLILTYVNDSTGVSQDSSLFNGLSGGTYTITISDGSCPAIDTTVTLMQPDSLILNVDAFTDVTCFNANDGSINLSASGGSPNYNFSIDGINSQSSGFFNALDSGAYMLSVVDTNMCSDSASLILSQPDSLIVTNLNVDSALCFGDMAAISFDGLGGTAPYTYSIDGVPTFGAANNFNVLAGNYAIQVQDSNNCVSEIVLDTVFEPSQLALSLDSSFNANCGATDGAIFVSPSGGTPPYQFSWSDGSTVVATTEDLTTAAAGIYTLTLTDANNCTAQVTQQVFDNAAVSLSVVSFDSVSCFGANDATVVLSADFGTEPYTFTVNNGTAQTDSVFTNLSGGLNTFEVTDTNGCTFSQQVNIYEPSDFILSANLVDLSCDESNDGEIVVNAVGGTLPYLFALNTSVLPQTSNQFTSLSAGTYTAYISDANNCIDSLENIMLEMPDTLIISAVSVTDVSCFGSADGEIVVTAMGGTLPYSYSVNSGTAQNTNSFSTLSGGVYTIELTDSNNCPMATAIDTILEPTQIVLSLDSSSNIICFGSLDGYIEMSATGGTSPYTYSIDGGLNYVTANTFNGLSAGNYNLIIKDDNGCTSSVQNLTLTEPAQINITGITADVSCFGFNDGSITLSNISGGTAPYFISLNGATAISYTANMVLDNLAGGINHTVEITDSLGCQNVFTYFVSEPIELVLVETNIVDVSCFGLTDGEVQVSATGGSAGYNFVFDGTNQSSANSSPVDFLTVDAGTYPVYVFDNNLCSDTILVTVNEPNELIIDSIVVLSEMSCFGANDAAMVVYPSGGSPNATSPLYSFSWTPNGESTDKISGLSAGVYTVTVTDANGCSVSGSETIDAVDPIIATITPDSAIINMGDTISLNVNVQNAAGPLTYSWSPTNGLSCTDCQNPDVTVYNDIVYSVVVTDTNGCANYNYTESFIFVNDSLFYFIPNSFTPNGDGINDQFQVFGQDIQGVNMMVFNRWGQMVFMGNNQFQTWDGTYQGVDQPVGVYTYTIVVTFLNGATVTENGSITLIR